MWYYPDFAALPERTQATVASLEKNNGDALAADEKTRRLLQSLKIEYRGDATPIEAQLTPGPALK